MSPFKFMCFLYTSYMVITESVQSFNWCDFLFFRQTSSSQANNILIKRVSNIPPSIFEDFFRSNILVHAMYTRKDFATIKSISWLRTVPPVCKVLSVETVRKKKNTQHRWWNSNFLLYIGTLPILSWITGNDDHSL